MKVRIPDTLNLPAQAKVEAELLKLLASRSRSLGTAEVYRTLAETFGLSRAQREARREASSSDPAWNWLVRRAMQRLEKEGWAQRPEHGAWAVTEKGRGEQRIREHGLPDIWAEEEG